VRVSRVARTTPVILAPLLVLAIAIPAAASQRGATGSARATAGQRRGTAPARAPASAPAPAPAPADSVDTGAPGPPSHRARTLAGPATTSAIAGYAWSQSPEHTGATESYFTYNVTGRPVDVDWASTGEYEVTFHGLGGINGGDVGVSVYGTAATCAIGSWSSDGESLFVTVSCFSYAGAPANADFDVMATLPRARSVPAGAYDYSLMYRPDSSGTLTGPTQYNSAHQVNSVRYSPAGKYEYQVTLGGRRPAGTTGVVKVTADGTAGGDCYAIGWHGSRAGEVVNVNCVSPASARQQRAFLLVYTAGNNLMAVNGLTGANAYANRPAGVYQPGDQYDSHRGAHVTVVRYGTGRYEVLFPGSEGRSGGGDVQVAAVGGTSRHCYVQSWRQQFTPAVQVTCVTNGDQLANSAFAVEWVVG
jgi:hypothetical protein